MHGSYVSFEFADMIDLDDARDTLRVSAFATEGVYGRVRVLLEADYEFCDDERRCWIGCNSEVSRHLARVFEAFIVREFGDAISINRRDEALMHA